MSVRFIGAAAAIFTCVALSPALAQSTAPASPSAGQGAQAQTQTQDETKPARRSRRKAETGDTVEKKSAKEPTVGQMAARQRQKTCGAEWKAAKAGGKLPEGMKWPKFWSQCNSRLKGKNV